MEIKEVKELTIKLKGKDAENFKSAIKKITDESKKIGLKNTSVTTEEMDLINSINSKIQNP